MNFPECVLYCAKHPEFLSNFDRLYGANLSLKGSPIELMVDVACKRQEKDWQAFVDFVYEYVWTRLPEEAFE